MQSDASMQTDCKTSAKVPATTAWRVKAIRKVINFLIHLEQHILREASKTGKP
jgi:hypothetical protein